MRSTIIYWILMALMKYDGKTMLPVLILDMIVLQYVVLRVVMMEMKETKLLRETSPFMRDRIVWINFQFYQEKYATSGVLLLTA